MKLSILVIDDDRAHAAATGEIVERLGHDVRLAHSGEEGITKLAGVDIVVTDLVMRDRSGLDVIAAARGGPPVIVVTGYGSEEAAPTARRAGAAAYLVKPLSVAMFRRVLERLAQDLDRRSQAGSFRGLVGRSETMQGLYGRIERVGDSQATVLIEGESGTGKELVARAVHDCSPRRHGPFVAVNCAALSASLLESELFGHERGAFTGAHTRRRGRFEAADGGTLMLDEIGEMEPGLQAKLLRALEEREIVRVGSNEPIPVDVRVVAATNRSLRERVGEGTFRADLFYRLNVVRLALPPLRERAEDIPELVATFLDDLAGQHGCERPGIEPRLLDRLRGLAWPGNVRELRNCVETMLLTGPGAELGPDDLPADIAGRRRPPAEGLSMRPIADVERELIANTLKELAGNRARAAEALGISARTLYRRIKELGLS
ncbi:MAG: sigma-54-dependent transcriptional regulator [Planctomycetota bacterium]|jgi:DNA-binding NtrC family response regulator